ncbi:hypothetical protein VTK73DRAFT_416 [Phialemonium thermophilum]|uniref:Uncharacterized protein n=1 Tax=Phialemonium thermophilum TaxID=223376 RepID=A0ABR3VV91_9PEZI
MYTNRKNRSDLWGRVCIPGTDGAKRLGSSPPNGAPSTEALQNPMTNAHPPSCPPRALGRRLPMRKRSPKPNPREIKQRTIDF